MSATKELFGPTVATMSTMTFDFGRSVGISVTFEKSTLRHAVKRPTFDEAVAAIREFIATAPYGRNRHGQIYEDRNP